MPTLKITFPASRYHATAWGTQVNEGIVEWPPCPWRLLRGLLASWHLKDVRGEISEEVMRDLLGRLASVAPSYRIPQTTAGHTRHYMPAPEKKTKIFDAFLHVAEGEALYVEWDIELDEPQAAALKTLAENWNYLGRAESLVAVEVVDSMPEGGNRVELAGQAGNGDSNLVRLLAPQTSDDFETWRTESKSKTAPADLFAALQIDTAVHKKQGWSQPPGSCWLSYAMPESTPRPSIRRRAIAETNPPTVARFTVVSDVAPGITQALSIGERLHQALMSRSDGHPVFSGRDPKTSKPSQGHQHAYYLCESTKSRGTVDFVTIYAEMGFDDDARRALEAVRKTWGYGGHDLQFVLLGLGQPEDFGGEKRAAGQSAVLAESKKWVSQTPFVPTRHPKLTRSGEAKIDAETGLPIGSPEHDLGRLLAGVGELAENPVSRKTCVAGSREIAPLQFQRQRKHGDGRKASNHGYPFEIEFKASVRGPIAVGYGAHFGLGLFVPAEE